MASAKGHGGLNQQGLDPCGDLIGIMAAIDKKPSSPHWRQFALYLGHPIGFL
jgi:hypothetical protein